MAFERVKTLKYANNLGNFIDAQLVLMKNNRATRNLDDEAKFTRAVLDDNLSYEQQLEHRKDQLNNVDQSDKDEKRRLKNEISKLNDLIEQKSYSDAYLAEVSKVNEGVQSIDATINWLQTRLDNTTDQAVKDDINKNLSELKGKRYESTISALTSQTEFANNNKTIEILDNQIDKVNKERSKALIAGNDDLVSTLDLQIQSLNKSKIETKINDAALKLAVSNIAGQSALSTLDYFNDNIKSGDKGTPITIGGVRYDSEAQFWEGKRADYLTDRTTNGFFGRYQGEIKDNIDYKQSKGILNNDSLADVNKWYDTLNGRPELTDYADRVALDKQASLQTTADLRAASTLNEYYTKGDAKKAINDLAYIQDTYGVSQTQNYQKVVAQAAQEKQQQVQDIISTMNSLMTSTPGMSSQDALSQAIKTGAGATFSPETLATTKASDIIKGAAATSEAQQFGEDGKGTIAPGLEARTFTSPTEPTAIPKFAEGGLYKDPNSSTVMKFEGGKLRTFVGNWDEDKFKQVTGKTFADVQPVANLTGVPQGEAFVASKELAPAAPNTPAAPAKGEIVSDPNLLKYYQPEQIVKEGTNIYLKPGVKSILGAKLNGESFGALQKQYDPATLESKVVRSGKDIYLKQ